MRITSRILWSTNMALLFGAVLPAAYGSDPPPYLLSERVDLVEVNHYFDEKGDFVLDQLIYYRWSQQAKRLHVEDYKLLKRPSQRPIRNVGANDYFSIWHEGYVLRSVHADSFLESWTQYDPEHRERQFLKHELRPGLAKMPEIELGESAIINR